MAEGIWEQLREAMDQYGTGYNATESGVEIEILKRLFNEEEARMYIQCTGQLEQAAVIAERAGRAPEEVLPLLRRMAANGLLFSTPAQKIEEATEFSAAAWIGGIIEFQSSLPGRMNPELAGLFVSYLKDEFVFRGNPLLRTVPATTTIPVNRELEDTRQVAPYDSVRELIKKQDKVLLAPCACCDLAGHLTVIDQPHEVCMLFGIMGDSFHDRGIGRWIPREEALKVLEKCHEAGLIHQATDLLKPECICNCGKFCGSLMTMKRHPRPAEASRSNYYAEVDASFCVSCEECVSHCHMSAIAMGQGAEVDRDRCIGCGVCVRTCPVGALSVKLKAEADRYVPPVSNPAWAITYPQK